MTADTGPVVARRPSATQQLALETATAEVAAAHARFIEAEDAYNAAAHARAQAISVAHFRDELTWAQCATACGLKHAASAQNICARLVEVTLLGKTLQPAGGIARRIREKGL